MVYAENGNKSIVFLKSTDDAMLDTLQKMSGTTHKVFDDQESITTDTERLFWRKNGSKTTTYSVKEVPVISYNDMAFIPMCNSIVFRAGDSPIWNRNQTCLPMSWRLFDNTITKPGKKYSLQTIPTLSSAMDFDVRQNQPNFIKMWEKRRDQAVVVPKVVEKYAKAYGYDDDAISRLDQDTYSDEIMEIVNEELAKKAQADAASKSAAAAQAVNKEVYSENKEFAQVAEQSAQQDAEWSKPRYANGLLSRKSLQPFFDTPTNLNHGLDDAIVEAFGLCRAAFAHDTDNFVFKSDGSLLGRDGTPYLVRTISQADVDAMQKAAEERDKRVFTESARAISSEFRGYDVTDAFYRFLISQESWKNFASGRFELAMAKIVKPENGD